MLRKQPGSHWILLSKEKVNVEVFKSCYTAWKVFKYGVISGPYFPAFGHFSRSVNSFNILSSSSSRWNQAFDDVLKRAAAMMNSLENSVVNKFTGEHPCLSVISIKWLFGNGLSLVNLLQFYKTTFPNITLEGCFWWI